MKEQYHGFDWYLPMYNALSARKYSNSTRECYLDACMHLAWGFSSVELQSLEKAQLEEYFAEMEERGVSASTINQAISAAIFLWRNIFEQSFPVKFRPRADRRLPVVLSRDEIMRLIASARKPEARVAMMLAYSAGLRVSEVVQLRVGDILRGTSCIRIRAGKGRKDRYVPLSPMVGDILDAYLKKYPSKRWIFKNTTSGHMHVRVLQHAIVVARKRAGFADTVTMHTLRHSFATHLAQRGTSLTRIQNLMGQTSLGALQRYLHFEPQGTLATASPLDSPPLF